LELFFDLIFVVVVAQLATRLSKDVSWAGVGKYVFAYLPVWLSWIIATLYANRFDTDDVGQRLITFAQMLTLAGMAASVAEETAIQFAASVALFRLLIAVSYLRVRASLPAAVGLANRMIALMATSAGIWFVSIFFDGSSRFAVWAIAIGVELTVAFIPSMRSRAASVPFHLSHLPERFGLFTIIVLGETVLAVVIGVAEADWATSAVVFAAVGLTISFALWWIYFESVTGRAMSALGGLRPVVWVLAHAPVVISITALGVGIEEAVSEEFGHALGSAEALLLAGSLAGALTAIGILVATEVAPNVSVRAFLKRLPAVAGVLVVGLLPLAAQAVLVGLAVIAATQAFLDVRASRFRTPI